jgi:pimeloyl-ACP methyl ester carboxylesterase
MAEVITSKKELWKRVEVPVKGASLEGVMGLAMKPKATIIFSHGSGSSHRSPRNQFVAQFLQEHQYNTLLVDLLTEQEDLIYANRFDLEKLSLRLGAITIWASQRQELGDAPFAFFGASTGSATALKLLADEAIQKACIELAMSQSSSFALKKQSPERVFKRVESVISRGGRPDLVVDQLDAIHIPVLLLVGELDFDVLALNKKAFQALKGRKELHVIPGASHLFEETGALKKVAEQTVHWLDRIFTIHK